MYIVNLLTVASCAEMQRLRCSQVFDHASTSLSHNDDYKLAHVIFETRILSLQKVALTHRSLAMSNRVTSAMHLSFRGCNVQA